MKFQTKLTYGMICYINVNQAIQIAVARFQTKLTYGMICYAKTEDRNI